MSDSTQLAKISPAAVRALVRENQADFEVFLPGPNGEDPVLYRRSGAGLRDPDFHRMAEHGVSAVYIRAEDLRECEQIIESKLIDILNNRDVAPEDKAEIVHSTGTTIARDLIHDSVSPASLDRTSSVLDGLIGCVLNDPIVAGYLLQMTGHERTTASHMFVVSTLAVMLGAAALGPDPELLRALGFAGMLHDVGKLSIAPEVLNKRAPLTREEMRFVQQHPIESVRLIGEHPHVSQVARQMIVQHHERVDGRGYPIGISGPDLLPGTRVLTIVDSFHAMIGQRSYRASLSPEDANRVLAAQADRQYDGEMLAHWQEMCRQYWSETDSDRRWPRPLKPDELSPRHEHRPALQVPRIVPTRPARHPCHARTAVLCVYAGRLIQTTPAPDEFNALVHDISRGGLCMYAAHPMYRGEVLYLQIRVNDEPVWLRSTVAWCGQQDANCYRVGLRFTDRVNAAQIREPASVLAMDEVVQPVISSAPAEGGGPEGRGKVGPPATIDEKRERALRTLAGIACMNRPNPEAQRIAVTLATSSDVNVRLKGVDVLTKMGTTIARHGLVVLLEDVNPEVRERAVQAVGAERVSEAAPTLRRLLDDPVERVALRAAGALGRVGDAGGLDLVEQKLETDGPEARLAAQALGDITKQRFQANREGVEAARRYLKAKKVLLGT
jgi:HD-GYP domain-containing protein (c-di-GMP phosphodiesterase class II)